MSKYDDVASQHEDEIVETYMQLQEEDFLLRHLVAFFGTLGVPACFTDDIVECVQLFYGIVEVLPTTDLGSKREILMQFLTSFTITSPADPLASAMDVVDIDKLVSSTHKLLKFRDNFDHIVSSWTLFVEAAGGPAPEEAVIRHRLTLTDLQKIKEALSVDNKKQTGTSFLIDMLSCGSTDVNGKLFDYDLEKSSNGLYVNIKDFANILGSLGELS